MRIIRALETGEAHTKGTVPVRWIRRHASFLLATIDYIRDDQTFVPKVAVVTIAGLGGLLLGHRGGPLRKTFYSSVAATVALSACYPKQSANLLDQVYLRVKNESKNLFDGKTPMASSIHGLACHHRCAIRTSNARRAQRPYSTHDESAWRTCRGCEG